METENKELVNCPHCLREISDAKLRPTAEELQEYVRRLISPTAQPYTKQYSIAGGAIKMDFSSNGTSPDLHSAIINEAVRAGEYTPDVSLRVELLLTLDTIRMGGEIVYSNRALMASLNDALRTKGSKDIYEIYKKHRDDVWTPFLAGRGSQIYAVAVNSMREFGKLQTALREAMLDESFYKGLGFAP